MCGVPTLQFRLDPYTSRTARAHRQPLPDVDNSCQAIQLARCKATLARKLAGEAASATPAVIRGRFDTASPRLPLEGGARRLNREAFGELTGGGTRQIRNVDAVGLAARAGRIHDHPRHLQPPVEGGLADRDNLDLAQRRDGGVAPQPSAAEQHGL